MLAREGRYKREAEARPLAISDCISLPGQHPHIPGKDINVTDDIYSAQKSAQIVAVRVEVLNYVRRFLEVLDKIR